MYIVVGLIGSSVFWLSVSIAVDSYFYGRFVIVVWKFIQFNVMGGHSASEKFVTCILLTFTVFGTQPWHWYATQGLPVMLLTMVPLVLIGFFVSKGSQKYPMYLVIYVLIVYSLFAHKEFRYVPI